MPTARQINGRGDAVGDFDGDLRENDPRALDGATFALEAPERIPSVWGDGERVAIAEGEPTLITAAPGLGKTTLLGQIVRRRLGLDDSDLLGLPVTPTDGRLLVISADRPNQGRRSMRRMVKPEDADTLRAGLVVWIGPLPFDLGRCNAGALMEFVSGFPEVSDLYIDTLGATATRLAEDEAGSIVSREGATVVAEGINLTAAHHNRKAQAGSTGPFTLDDVYGSRWLTAGMGSVLHLAGNPGDPILELRQLKSPAADIGPLSVIVDHERGELTLHENRGPYEIVRDSNGATAKAAAVEMFGSKEPSRAETEKARRRLDAHPRLARVPDSDPTLWRVLDRETA